MDNEEWFNEEHMARLIQEGNGTTVQQVIDYLSKFPKDTVVFMDGADCGGYDVTVGNRIHMATLKEYPYLRHIDEKI